MFHQITKGSRLFLEHLCNVTLSNYSAIRENRGFVGTRWIVPPVIYREFGVGAMHRAQNVRLAYVV